MAESIPLKISRTSTHGCTSVIPGSAFKQLGRGHWAATVSHSAGPTAEHSTGRSPLFARAKDDYNTTTIHSVHVSGKGGSTGTVGISFYNKNAAGSMDPMDTHPGSGDARVHVTDKHGLTYHAVVPAGMNTPQTIHWKMHDYSADDVAKINAIAPLHEPFKEPQIFEADGDGKKSGVVYYRSNDENPCVAQRLFSQNPTEMAKIQKTTISNGDDADGTFFEVPSRLHADVTKHIEKLKTAHEVLSKTSSSPGMAVHVIGATERPDFVHVHVVHSNTESSKLPKPPSQPDMFTINADGGVTTTEVKSFKLKPIGGGAAADGGDSA